MVERQATACGGVCGDVESQVAGDDGPQPMDHRRDRRSWPEYSGRRCGGLKREEPDAKEVKTAAIGNIGRALFGPWRAEWALGELTPVEVTLKVLEILVRPEVWMTGAGPYDPITGELGKDYRALVLYKNPHLTASCVRWEPSRELTSFVPTFPRLDVQRLRNPESLGAAAFVPRDGSLSQSRLPEPQCSGLAPAAARVAAGDPSE